MMEDFQTAIVPFVLSDGSIVNIETTIRGEQQVSAETGSFAQVTETIRAVAMEMVSVIEAAKPDKLAIKFGVEVAVESGKLTSLVVKGSGKANLEITLEWGRST